MDGGTPLADAGRGQGTWERTARHIALLAGELGIALNAEDLAWGDVRDLLAVRECLRHHLRHPPSRLPWPSARHPCCARAHVFLAATHAS